MLHFVQQGLLDVLICGTVELWIRSRKDTILQFIQQELLAWPIGFSSEVSTIRNMRPKWVLSEPDGHRVSLAILADENTVDR